MKAKLINTVSDIISVSADEIQNNPSSFGIGKPEAWDSLAHLAIMTEIEDLLNEELSIAEMESMNNMQKILDRFAD